MRKRRIISPLQAVLLVFLVGLLVLWLKLGTSRRGKANEGGEERLRPAFPADSISEIDLERGGATFRLVREGDGFWLTEPYRDRADAELIAQSIQIASTLRPLRVLPDTVAAPFGLDHPASVWECRWPRGTYRIAIGDSLPGGGGRYAKRTGSPEVLVIDPFLARRYIAPSIRSLHDPVAARVGVGPVDSVRVTTRDESLVIVRKRNDLWQIVSPIAAEASALELLRGVQALRGAEMTEFLGPKKDFDLRSLGLDPPRAVWTLVQGNRRFTVSIGHPTPDQKSVRIIPADRDVVCLIGSECFRTWVDGLRRLREARLIRAEPDSLVRVVVNRSGQRRVFARLADRGWYELSGADTLDLQQDAMERATTNLCATQAVSFATPWPVRTERVLRLDLLFRGGEEDTVQVAPAAAGLSPVRAARLPGECAVAGMLYETWSLWLERPFRN